MGKKNNKNKKNKPYTQNNPTQISTEEDTQQPSSKFYPKVSLCTPTFNRRPFIPFMIKCFDLQVYPKDKIEWIIIDDGTDKIGDLVSHIPQVKYYAYNEKMTLGKKRNLMHEKSTGEILIYMDDDDYYPPDRISHAVTTLQKNPQALCAGSSEMYIYFKHIGKMIQFGPYGPNHATAATFAFRRSLLAQTRYEEHACVAEEKHFLKGYTIPFVQLDPMKTILVFSHIHNSFDKKTLLNTGPNPYQKESTKKVEDFVKEPEIRKFFLEDIEPLLNQYEPGRPENKPDVTKQLEEIRVQREKQMLQQQQFQQQQQLQSQNNSVPPQFLSQMIQYEKKINEQTVSINELTLENTMLKDKTKYLEGKISDLIKEMILLKK
jgi:hypothetical protein